MDVSEPGGPRILIRSHAPASLGDAKAQQLADGKTYRDLDNYGENAMLALRSLSDHSERVDIKRRTTKALTYLSSNGVKLGAKPVLTEADVERIRHLRAGGLGVQAISKTVRKEGKDGRLKPISVNTVKPALSGSYMTREEWHSHTTGRGRTLHPFVVVAGALRLRYEQALGGERLTFVI